MTALIVPTEAGSAWVRGVMNLTPQNQDICFPAALAYNPYGIKRSVRVDECSELFLVRRIILSEFYQPFQGVTSSTCLGVKTTR